MSSETRIGIVVVHGVGEQGSMTYLSSTAEAIASAIKTNFPEEESIVSMIMNEGDSIAFGAMQTSWETGPEPSIEVIVRIQTTNQVTRIGLHEVWWGDVIERRTLCQQIKFWWWGLGMWAEKSVRPDWAKDNPDILFPSAPSHDFKDNIPAWLQLLFAGSFASSAFLLFKLAHILSRNLIPDIGQLMVNYLADVKMFISEENEAQRTKPELTDAMPRRALRARAIRGFTDAALKDYDRWYVFGHSLGSVIAYNALMLPPAGIARLLDEGRWKRCMHQTTSSSEYETLIHKRPAWLQTSDGVDRSWLFARFAGFVTYGSPLDKFATLWNWLVPGNKEESPLAGRPWINLWDPTDPIAGHLNGFAYWNANQKRRFFPTNISCKSHIVPLLSHIKYLSNDRGYFVEPIVSWLIHGVGKRGADLSIWENFDLSRSSIIRRRRVNALLLFVLYAVTSIFNTILILIMLFVLSLLIILISFFINFIKADIAINLENLYGTIMTIKNHMLTNKFIAVLVVFSLPICVTLFIGCVTRFMGVVRRAFNSPVAS